MKSRLLQNLLINQSIGFDIYLASIDLETPLLVDYYKETSDQKILKLMQGKKATSMFKFLSENQGGLNVLKQSSIAKPLLRCKELAKVVYNDSI